MNGSSVGGDEATRSTDRARRRSLKTTTMSSGSHSSCQRVDRRQRQRRQRALADDHRMDELDRDVARVGLLADAPAAARRAGSAAPSRRTAPPAAPTRRRRTRVFARVRSCVTPPPCGAPAAPRASRGTRPRPRPCARSPASSRTPGCTVSRRARHLSTSKSTCGSRSILFSTTSSHARNISGYFSGLSSPSVTEATITRASSPTRNSAGQTRLPTFSITSRSISSSGIDGSARAHHVRVQVALAAEALRRSAAASPGTCSEASRSASSEPCTSPSSTPARTPPRSRSTRSSSAVLPAPGRAHQVRDGHAVRGRSRRGWRARSCCWRRARPRRS